MTRQKQAGVPRREKSRLDVAVFERGLAPSRKRAQALIMAGKVTVNGQVEIRPSAPVVEGDEIVIKEPDHPYVSRGGIKLAHALKELPVDFRRRVVLDVGASTGGFTDCLLRHGAAEVISLDVGYGQLDWKLRNDRRVHVMERTNVRYLTADQLPLQPDAAVADVSFISLRLVLPVLRQLLPDGSPLVLLVKPQFELSRKDVGRKGVVRDPKKHLEAVNSVINLGQALGFTVCGHVESPILGPKGNREFLVAMRLPQEDEP